MKCHVPESETPLAGANENKDLEGEVPEVFHVAPVCGTLNALS